jgi:leucyl-tRNA synthetase
MASLFLKMLAPYAPHLSEELWEKLGHKTLLAQETWPAFDASLVIDDEALIIIQVNGKKRGELSLPKTLSAKEIEKKVLENEAAIKFMEGKIPKRVIVVPGRLVNIVV